MFIAWSIGTSNIQVRRKRRKAIERRRPESMLEMHVDTSILFRDVDEMYRGGS